MKPEQHTLPKSNEPSIFVETTKAEILEKKNYIEAHLTQLKTYFGGMRINRVIEHYKHGQQYVSNPPHKRKLYGKMYTVLLEHLKLMEKEHKRLTLLYNS